MATVPLPGCLAFATWGRVSSTLPSWVGMSLTLANGQEQVWRSQKFGKIISSRTWPFLMLFGSLRPPHDEPLLAHRKWETTPCRDAQPRNQPTYQSPEIRVWSHEAILTHLRCQLTAETHQASLDPVNSPLTHRIVRHNISCLLFETAMFWSSLLPGKG